MRRAAIVLVAAVGAFFLAAAAYAQRPAPSPRPPIKIGMLHEVTGVYAELARDEHDGMKVALDEVGGEIAGRKIEALVEDTGIDPATALTKTKKLVESNRVHALTGVIWSPNAVAIRDYVCNTAKVPYLASVAAPRMLTQEGRCSYIFRSGFSSGQEIIPYGKYAYEGYGFKKMAIYSFDSVFGREQAGYFKKAFEEAGGKIVLEIFAPVNTADHAPYLAQIKAAKVDALAAWWSGSAAIRFIKQFVEYGLKEDGIRIIGVRALVDESTFPSLGDLVLGVGTVHIYSPVLNNPENKKFVAAYTAKTGREPGVFSEYGYTAMRVILEALKAINGNVEDVPRFIQALEQVRIAAPRGPFRFDEFHQGIMNIVFQEARKVDGKIVNQIIHTVPNAEQYWPTGKPKAQR